MNKIIVDNNIDHNDIFINEDTYLVINLDNIEKNINIHVVSGVTLKGFIKVKNTKNKVTYNIDDNCNVVINKMGVDTSDNVVINLDSKSRLKYYTSIINYNDNNYYQTINNNKSDITCKVVNHCINVKDNNFKFIIDGVIKKDSIRVDFNQDNKIINLRNGKSNILPNLIVDSDDVLASHSAYIGTFDEDKKFYMMSRGITEEESSDLLIKAFLLNDMDLDEEEKDIYCGIIEKINK